MLAKDCELPANENNRIHALQRYNVLDSPPDGAFDTITRLLAKLLEAPIAIVSLVDHDRIWFKSARGLDISEIDRAPGLCASAILQNGPYLVDSARTDPRTLTNPLVAGEFGLKAYAAAPLTTHDGYNLGTVCCLDFKDREWTPMQAEILSDFASIVIDELELRLAARRIDGLNEQIIDLIRQLEIDASHDSLTGLWNRSAILKFANKTMELAKRQDSPVSMLMIDVDHFKAINDQWGHPVGDQVLKTISRRLTDCLRESDSIGRIGGEEFIALLFDCEGTGAQAVAERCRRVISDHPIAIEHNGSSNSLIVTISVGICSTADHRDASRDTLIKYADDALYQAKNAGRNRVFYRHQ